MLFPEEDAPLLKAWIVKRIENTSDADSDVLAEYVIALLKHDGDQASVRKLCEEEIPDFLTEDPKPFLDDVFQAIKYKSYLPGASLPPKPVANEAAQPSAPSNGQHAYDSFAPSPPRGHPRKRGYQDLDDPDYQDSHYPGQGVRALKQARRNGRRGRAGDARGGRFKGFSPMPGASGFPPFGPNNPLSMEALMQMQAMGLPFPPLGKSPDFPASTDAPRRRGRCRDFDTKGYCSRGSTCQYDHGNESSYVPPPGAQDGEWLSLQVPFTPSSACLLALPELTEPLFCIEYDPNHAVLPGGGPFDPAQYLQAMNAFMSGLQPGRGRGGRRDRGARKRGARAPFSADGPVNDRSKTTIVVESIPEESFSEEKVREFFSQFGNIVEVSMQPYKHLAIVKYDNWNAANAAYRSPKVIFENRFVKVFWYKDEADNVASGKHENGGSVNGSVEPEPELFDLEDFQRRQEEAQKQHQEREAKREEIERQRRELERQQEELLSRHRQESERLQAKLAEKNGADPAAASSGTEMLRAKLAALEQEAKLLGIDPNAADEFGGYPAAGGGGYRGRGGFRGRGYAPRGRGGFARGQDSRHAAYAQYSLDNRPRKLAITGVDFTTPEKDEVLRHFLLNLGEFESVEPSPTVTHVAFRDRKTAERFYHALHDKELAGIDGKLQLDWVKSAGGGGSSSNGASGTGSSALPPQQEGKQQQAGSDPAGLGAVEDDLSEDGEVPDDDHRGGQQVDMDYEVGDQDDWGE
ncbi:RNA-binding protein [Paramyrothecium foliicola]|nr:RNA-binding protein [Paramyrothecium foliicola]